MVRSSHHASHNLSKAIFEGVFPLISSAMAGGGQFWGTKEWGGMNPKICVVMNSKILGKGDDGRFKLFGFFHGWTSGM